MIIIIIIKIINSPVTVIVCGLIGNCIFHYIN